MDQLGRDNGGLGYGVREQQQCDNGVSGWGSGGGRGGWGAPVVTSSPWGTDTTTTTTTAPDALASILASMEISPSPVHRPDRGGSPVANNNTLWLCVHNLPLQFDEKMIIYHYDVDVWPESLPVAVRKELFGAYAAQCPLRILAYDGQRTLLTPSLLSEGDFRLAVRGRMLHLALKLLQAAPLQELHIDAGNVMYFA